jgi:hypothetical protein
MKKRESAVRHSEPIEKRKLFPELEELSPAESVKIAGGSSLWYWIGYVVGYIGQTEAKSSNAQPAGPAFITPA